MTLLLKHTFSCYDKDMLFGKPSLLIYLSSHSLVIYTLTAKSFTFSFTPDLVENLEVKDPEKLTTNLFHFLNSEKIPKDTAVMVLAEDLIFRRDILEKDPEKFQQEIKKYVEEIPLEPQKIVYKILEIKNKYTLAGTNKELYSKFKEILTKYGFNIKYIIPLCASWIGEINLNTVKEILSDSKTLKIANYLQKNLSSKNIKSQKKPPKEHKLLLVIIIILLTAMLSEAIFYLFLSSSGPSAEKTESISPAPTKKPLPTTPVVKLTTPAPLKIIKEKLKIQVLNGNGGVGVAAGAKAILENAGYQNIDTGNAGKYDYENTIIRVKENEDEILNMLSDDLKKDYSIAPALDFLDSDDPYDAVIIVGLK